MAVLVDHANAIRTRFNAQITLGGDGGAAVVTRWPNDNQPEPASGPWARVTIREGERQQVTTGSSPRSRTVGALYVELFDEAGSGTATLAALAERVRQAFQRVTASGVTYRTPGWGAGGSSGDRAGKWWRVTVVVRWYADDTE